MIRAVKRLGRLKGQTLQKDEGEVGKWRSIYLTPRLEVYNIKSQFSKDTC